MKKSGPTCPANDLPEEIKDVTWHFLVMGGQKADIPALKESVRELVKATTQKTAGQKEEYRKRAHIDWNSVDSIMWRIVMEATALVLSGELGDWENT